MLYFNGTAIFEINFTEIEHFVVLISFIKNDMLSIEVHHCTFKILKTLTFKISQKRIFTTS